mgnify:CR=1 FL=1
MDDSIDDTKVEYDDSIMWFDYQSLFDKTKNVILGINCDVEIEHTNFKCNKCAANATGIKDNKDLLKSILSGNIDSVCQVVNNIYNYYVDQMYTDGDLSFEQDICIKNYCYLLAIASIIMRF